MENYPTSSLLEPDWGLIDFSQCSEPSLYYDEGFNVATYLHNQNPYTSYFLGISLDNPSDQPLEEENQGAETVSFSDLFQPFDFEAAETQNNASKATTQQNTAKLRPKKRQTRAVKSEPICVRCNQPTNRKTTICHSCDKQCSICKKLFKAGKDRVRHEKRGHSQEEADKAREFNCSYCGKIFLRIQHLQRHQKPKEAHRRCRGDFNFAI